MKILRIITLLLFIVSLSCGDVAVTGPGDDIIYPCKLPGKPVVNADSINGDC